MIPGVDLGNHRVKIGVPDSTGTSRILTNRFGEAFTRSVPYFAEDGSILVGTEAENAALANPERAVFDWKRGMGTEDVLCTVNGKDYRAKDVAVILLNDTKETIETKTGEPVNEVVITIPANYNDVQKRQTIDAAAEVGMKVLVLPHEPTAAALGNDFHKKRDCLAGVFDMGGGTFDFSIVGTKGNVFQVIATNGVPKLGGKDFNDRVKEKVLEQFEGKHGYRPSQSENPIFFQDLAQRVEQLKLALSVQQQAQIIMSCNGDQLNMTVTRDQFNCWVLPLVEIAMNKMEQTVKEASLVWPDIREIYAVGGGSLMPIVIEKLEQMTGKKVSRRCEPHGAAALGAVIMGRLECARLGRSYPLGERTLPPPSFYLREILSLAIGVAVLDDNQKEVCAEILPKNTPIPSVQTRNFKMSEPDQTEVLIRVLDGEEGTEAAKCVELGRFELKGLPARPDLVARIEIVFQLDASGMLTATARDIVSGKTAELQITYKNKADAA